MCDKILREKAREISTDDYNEVTNDTISNDINGHVSPWPPLLTSWCPRASSYYACTEDINPFDRIKDLADDTNWKSFDDYHAHFDPPLDPLTIRDPYNEDTSREKYLRSDPVCFAIFGKPGLGSEKLAKIISETWSCVLISPESLIDEEIDKKTEQGLRLADALLKGDRISPDLIMTLINSRVNHRDVMHRGYVVEGLPLIPSNPETESSSPEVVSVDEPLEPFCTCESETSSLQSKSSKTLTSSDKSNKKCEDYIPEQIEQIFYTWPLKPTIIIYMICPNDDAVERRSDFRFDSSTGKTVDTRKSHDPNHPFDDVHSEQYLLRRLSDIATNVKLQCEIYQRYALPVIDRQVLKHNPQNVIRVDGRTSVHQIFQVINTKLRSLPLARVAMPKKFSELVETFDGDESEKPFEYELDSNFEGRNNEEILEELSTKSTISSRFPWSLSKWKYSCPVELARGRSIEGKAEHAVRFMNKIFFSSSLEAMEIFIENPRTFLLPYKTPRAICRIGIFGPKYSGKSGLSNALGRNFQANVIDLHKLERGMKDDRIDAKVADTVRKAVDHVIPDLKMQLETERQSREDSRREGLHLWLREVEEILGEFKSLQESDSSEDKEHLDPGVISEKLRGYSLGFLIENHELLENLQRNQSELIGYAPDDLRNEEPPIRELSEHDPEVSIILENEVKHLRNEKVVITSSEIAESLISRIRMMPEQQIGGGLFREPEWIIDGLHPDPEIWRILQEAGVAFEHLILIIDDDPYENLIANWKRFNETDYQDEENENNPQDNDMNHFPERSVESYIADIKEFENKWENFSQVLDEINIKTFVCNLSVTSNVYKSVSKHINERYDLPAKIMSEEEREREFENLIESITDIGEEELEDEQDSEVSRVDKPVEKDSRRLGDTGIYCPVILARNNVLWKGKEEFSALFRDKIYLCSSAEALDRFVKDPESFNLPFEKPPNIPFARICIVGTPGSGKSTLAKMLSEEFEIMSINFWDRLNAYMSDRGIIAVNTPEDADLPSDLTDQKYNTDKNTILAFVKNYKKQYATLPDKIFDECFVKFFRPPYDTAPIIFDSFPNCLEDVDVAIKNYAVPELVIELQCGLDKVQERLLPGLMEVVKKKEDTEKKEGEENEEKNLEENTDRILQEIEESYERKNDALDKTRRKAEEESIAWITLDVDKTPTVLLSDLRNIIRPLIIRKSSILERTYEVDPYTAESLLECGYYFLSSFGRSCPVQMYQKKNPVQMYLPMEEENQIYTVLYRQYVYFIAGSESSRLFMEDPVKYICQDSCDPVIPAQISIVGPPHCGKSTLAERFARAYGMRIITPDEVLRSAGKNYKWTKTGREIEEAFLCGREVSKKCLARAVELYILDPRSSSQGYVFDGFPTVIEEYEKLELLNIRPMIVISLQADENFCLSSLPISQQEDTIQNLVLFSSYDTWGESSDVDQDIPKPANSPFSISKRYESWEENSPAFLNWLNKYAQNVIEIDATTSKWAVWRYANQKFCSKFADIKRYIRESDYDKVHKLENLIVSSYEFEIRQSLYENYCPCCLHNEDSLQFSGPPPDRRGVVQFRKHFYWICSKHFEDFRRYPLVNLPPQSAVNLPTERPEIFDGEVDLQDHRLRANGNCLVTYVHALPDYKIIPGQTNLGVMYKNRLYLFSSMECREKFLSRPWKYSEIEIDYDKIPAAVEIKNLSILEFLKKTVADVIVKAVTEVAAERPKYPGMTPNISAAVFIGVYLKTHNVNGNLDEIGVYEEVRKRLKTHSHIVRIALKNMKRIINPYVGITKLHTLT